MLDSFYRRMRALARFLMALLFPIRALGIENVPGDRAGLLCINHISLIDPVAVACALNRPIRYIGKKELFKGRWLGRALTRLGAFPVDRGGADLSAMRTSLAILREGGLLGIFPQGHRFKDGEGREIETGAAMMALRTGVPVIPVRIYAPYRLFRRLVMRFGAPVTLQDLGGKLDAETLREATRRISAAIWAD